MAPKTPQSRPKEQVANGKDSNIGLSLLCRAHSPELAATIFTEKVKTRPLYLKPTEPNNARQARRLERQRKLSERKKRLKPALLSSRQKRALCIYDIPKSSQKYSIYEPLHKMWIGYIQEVLGEKCTPVTGAAAAKLCSADYHGAELEVVRSRCVSRVGVKGIVVKDTKFVFEIITKNNQIKVVPKENTVFRFAVPPPGVEKEVDENAGKEVVGAEGKDLVFELHGDQFIFRAADRANKKFKTHFLPDL
ncbi:hypothetical protein G7Y89_g10186 [Cudoniella acicularis]|uniref:Ribonuclease P protein subunit n=1 Tax=Cudoniella acicularis TaxID=354080 RepID=A0A8H4RGZ0_9HELO|nr:hypothetical protein G7Y89_g10186 [Cudoniella acicularis]